MILAGSYLNKSFVSKCNPRPRFQIFFKFKSFLFIRKRNSGDNFFRGASCVECSVTTFQNIHYPDGFHETNAGIYIYIKQGILNLAKASENKEALLCSS